MHRRLLAALAAIALLVAGLALPGGAQTRTTLVFSAGPTGGTWTPMAAATAEVIKKKYPALLFQGSWTEIVQALISGGIGVVALSAALEGYWLRTATWLERGLFLVAALLLIDPRLITDAVGLVLLLVALSLQKLRRPESVATPALP